MVPLLKNTSLIRTIIWQQVLGMPLILHLHKGHLSNEDRIIWEKGWPYCRGDCCSHLLSSSLSSSMSRSFGTQVWVSRRRRLLLESGFTPKFNPYESAMSKAESRPQSARLRVVRAVEAGMGGGGRERERQRKHQCEVVQHRKFKH